MKKYCKYALNLGLIISFGLGVLHFFIPHIFKWYSYIPDAPRSLIVSIDWLNFFFSLLLSGFSLLLLIFQNEIRKRLRGVFEFYVLFVMLWLARAVMTYMNPWNNDFQMIDKIQISSFSFIFLLLFIPMIYFWIKNSSDIKKQ